MSEEGVVCALPPRGNLNRTGTMLRQAVGVAGAAASVYVAWQIHGAGLDRIWRLTVFLPLLATAVGFIQAREKT